MESYSPEDSEKGIIIEAIYSYELFVPLVDDFIKALHELENYLDYKNRRPDNTVIMFRIFGKQEAAFSPEDGKFILPCTGVSIIRMGVINENN